MPAARLYAANLKPGVLSSCGNGGYASCRRSHSGLVVPPQTAVDFVRCARTRGKAFSLDLPFPHTRNAGRLCAPGTGNWSDGGRTTSWFLRCYPDYSINDVIWTHNQRSPAGAGDRNPGQSLRPECLLRRPQWDRLCAELRGEQWHSSLARLRAGRVGDDGLHRRRCALRVGLGQPGRAGAHGRRHLLHPATHLATVDVAVGQQVAAGATFGMMGTTSNSTGIHLHFRRHRGDGDGIWEDRT